MSLEGLNVAIGPLSFNFNFQASGGAKGPGQALFTVVGPLPVLALGPRGRGLAVGPYFTGLNSRTSNLIDNNLE